MRTRAALGRLLLTVFALTLGTLPAQAKPKDPILLEWPSPPLHVVTFGSESALGMTATAPETTWFGGTAWAADSMRWEALRDSVWTFDSGVGSHFNHSAPGIEPGKDPTLHAYMEGWVGRDQYNPGSEQIGFFRRRARSEFPIDVCVGTDAGLSGDYSLWAGLLESEACYFAGQGYGNDWSVGMERSFTTDGTGAVTLSFDYDMDLEENFDFAYVDVDTAGTGTFLINVLTLTGVASGTGMVTLTPGSTLRSDAGPLTLRFRVDTDGGYSDADGAYPTDCGAIAIDDVSVTGGGIAYSEDFETDDGGWTPSIVYPLFPPPSARGDFSRLVHLADLPAITTECVCTANDSVLVFTDPSVGYHPEWAFNIAYSPWIDLARHGVENTERRIIQVGGIHSLYGIPGRYYPIIGIQACDGTGVSDMEWRGFGKYPFFCDEVGGEPILIDATDYTPAGSQIRIGVGVFSQCGWFSHDCTPWIDNADIRFDDIRFGVADSPAVIKLTANSGPSDAFPLDGTLDIDATGRIDRAGFAPKSYSGPEPPSVQGDTLTVEVVSSDPIEVRTQFTIVPGPGTDTAALNTWLTQHPLEEIRDGLSWYSARMDTAERAPFVFSPGVWMTAYHEEDPNFSGTDTDLDPNDPYTRLANDIFPDFLLTPGARLMLFYKARPLVGGAWGIAPDTTGGHFLEMEVLPSSLDTTGVSNCLLVVNQTPNGEDLATLESALTTILGPGGNNFEGTLWDRWDGSDVHEWNSFPPGSINNRAVATQLEAYDTILWFGEDESSLLIYPQVLIDWLDSGGGHGFYIAANQVLTESYQPQWLSNTLLETYFGAEDVCSDVHRVDCPPGSVEDTTGCMPLGPAPGAVVAGSLPGGRPGPHAADARPPTIDPLVLDRCPVINDLEVLSVATSGLGAPQGDETFEAPIKGTVSYASISNDGGDWKTVIDVTPLPWRKDATCTGDAPVEERLREVLGFFGVGAGSLCVTPPVTAVPEPGPAWTTRLYAPSPNPWRSGPARIRFELAEPGPVRLDVFDIAGRRVKRIVAGTLAAGPQSVTWDGTDDRGIALARGVYLYRLSTNQGARSRKVVVDR